MDYQQLIENMSSEMYESFKRSVELGKWPDGKAVTPRQRDNAMQAIIAWGEKHLNEGERVGFINIKHKAGDSCDEPQSTILNWKE